MAASTVQIIVDHALSDDPVFTVEVQTPSGSLDVMAEVTFSGRSLTLNRMHIGGDTVRNWGAAVLREIAQAVMEELDVDEILVTGGVRTTGANPERDPRTRRLRRASKP